MLRDDEEAMSPAAKNSDFITKQWTGKFHGMLEKHSKFMGKDQWHQRWFVLSESGNLLRFEHPSAPKPKSAVSLAKGSVKADVMGMQKPHVFQIVVQGNESLTLAAPSEENKKEWIMQLREVITDVSQRETD